MNTSKIDSLKAIINTKNIAKIDSIYSYSIKYNDTLNKIYNNYLGYQIVSKDLKIHNDSITKWFTHNKPKKLDQEEPKTETQVYTYFGKDEIIKKDFIDKSTVQGRVLNQVLNNTNEKSYFGDITIPKENLEIPFVNKKGDALINKKYKFKKLEVEIRDGSFADIRVTVGYKGNVHTFENHSGVSLMYFSNIANYQNLFYTQSIINNSNYNLKELKHLYIRLSDVMNYTYKIGNHYIPHDLTIELPQKDLENKKTNTDSSASYEIKQKTYLDKIVEFRTYTDFLSLFGEGNNGLVSLEANAKFYVFPYVRQIFNTKGSWEFFPSVNTSVIYNKFEKETSTVTIPTYNFTNSLDLIEKRFLTMGANFNVLQLKHKKFPIATTIFGAANYQLTRVNINSISENAKAFGYGFGIDLNTKRFNNFGFKLRGELNWYDYKNSNTFTDLDIKVPVLKTHTEVFYHPTKSPNQAIFLRLATYNYKGSDNNQAFYQFQFGYKFSIGSRTITKK